MTIIISNCGNDANEAFERAKDNIATLDNSENSDFLKFNGFTVMEPYPENTDPMKFAKTLNEKIDINPSEYCICVPAGDGEYIFMGKPPE